MGCRKGPSKSLREDFGTMSRVPSLSSPFLLGFDEIERVLDRVAKGADGYPPYNIERLPRDDDKTRHFLLRGFAARQFQRTFVLADGMEVMGADLKHGLLSVDLVRPQPERIVRSIAINDLE